MKGSEGRGHTDTRWLYTMVCCHDHMKLFVGPRHHKRAVNYLEHWRALFAAQTKKTKRKYVITPYLERED